MAEKLRVIEASSLTGMSVSVVVLDSDKQLAFLEFMVAQ